MKIAAIANATKVKNPNTGAKLKSPDPRLLTNRPRMKPTKRIATGIIQESIVIVIADVIIVSKAPYRFLSR